MARATDPLRFLKLYRQVRGTSHLRAAQGEVHHPAVQSTLLCSSVTSHRLASQDVRSGLRDCKVYQEVVHELTVQIQKQPPAPDTIAARLLAVIVRFVVC
jgi:hypothetical protein